MKALAINIVFTDKYFDITEFKDVPLKQILKYEFRPLNNYFKTGLLYSMKKNTIKVQNSWLGFGDKHEYTYYSYEKKDAYILEYDQSGWEDDIFSLYVVEEENEMESKRDVLTFVGVIEGLGGFLSIMAIACSFLIGPVNQFLYQRYLVKNLYLLQKDSKAAVQTKDASFLKLQQKLNKGSFSLQTFSYYRRKILLRVPFELTLYDRVFCCKK